MQYCSSFLNIRYILRHSAILANAAVVAGSSTSATPLCPTSPCHRPDHKLRQLRPFTSTSTVREENGQGLATFDRLNSPLSKTNFRASTAGTDQLVQPPWASRGDPNAWVAYLEPYLPSQLRRLSSQYPFEVDQNTQKPLEDLPRLLFQARRQSNVDVLSYIGVQQDRWQAVLWIVRNILRDSPWGDAFTEKITAISSPTVKWSTDLLLEEATQSAIWAERQNMDRSASVEDLETQTGWDYWAIERSSAGVSLSQIWQSLGSMVLEAAERTGDEARCIMSHVLQIIAFLHHNDMIPGTIYSYEPAENRLFLERPPTLHLLSSRILTALADAAWRAQERQVAAEAAAVGAKYHHLGFEVPEARYKLKVRELGPEVWMELILWSCVDGGLVKEGAWILEQLRKRTGEKKWSVIDWKAVQQPAVGDDPKTAWVDWEGVRDRTDGVGIGSIEGYSGERPFVELGERTTSSEVVAALVNGLVDSIRVGVGYRGNAASTILDSLFVLKNILDRDKFGLGPKSWNQIIIRILDSGGVDPEADPGILERILELAPTYLKELEASNAPVLGDDGFMLPSHIFEQSAIAIGLSHRVLRAYIKSGNIGGSIRAFARLQALTDANKKKSITEFIGQLKRQGREIASDGDVTDRLFDPPISEVPGFSPQIPLPILASFLDLVTESKAYDFGRWLVHADEIDGPVIPEKLYGSPWVTPALLRFAATTSDDELLEKIARALQSPLQGRTLRELLHCQISFRRWDAVEDVLTYARDEVTTDVKAQDAAALAKAVLVLEAAGHHPSIESHNAETGSLTRAKDILKRLLHGEFTSSMTPSPTGNPLFFKSSFSMESLCQIFKTISKTLSELCPADSDDVQEAVRLPIEAFNIILSAVVETQSSIEGKRLWDLYCRPPEPPSQDNIDAGVPRRPWKREDQREEDRALAASRKPPARNAVPREGRERLIIPNLSTLRLITQAAVRERQELLKTIPHDEADPDHASDTSTDSPTAKSVREQVDALDDLLKWARGIFRDFLVAEEDIDMELGGSQPQKRKRRRPSKSARGVADSELVSSLSA